MADRDFASGRASGCGIAVMAKASTPGLTKTRLVPPLRFEEAARLRDEVHELKRELREVG